MKTRLFEVKQIVDWKGKFFTLPVPSQFRRIVQRVLFGHFKKKGSLLGQSQLVKTLL